MAEKNDDQVLIEFWDKALALSEEDRQACQEEEADWRELAPSEKLFRAAESLGQKKKVLDYGCGNGWAGIIAAKSGCPDVTAVDVSAGPVEAAQFFAGLFGAGDRMQVRCEAPDWLAGVPAGTYDGLICSNVLDIVPPETAEAILREAARVVTADADVIIGLNYYLSPEKAAARGLELQDGCKLYVDGVLRLVSRSDGEWAEIFSPYFTVERLEYFAWPGEETETRRLFRLRKKANLRCLTLREAPELMRPAAEWFHSKWGVPEEAYRKCMEAYLGAETEYGWYLCLDGDRIVGGMGVIENDFHDRKDLAPNVCAVYTEEAYRGRGIAGRLLDMVVDDMRGKGISPLYLVTDHTGFYERYGWEFLCMVQGDGEPDMTRMYIHR